MKVRRISFILVGLLLLTLLVQTSFFNDALAAGPGNNNNQNSPDNIELCGITAPGTARCNAYKHLKKDVEINATTGIAGYDASDLQSAYNLAASSASRGSGKTVAIVDAFDDPNAAADLAVYRAKFGLPPLATCPAVSGPCFKKVNQQGVEGSYPAPDNGWSGEIALDIEMVSAICPNCNILLVEATTNYFSDLMLAVDTAASLGANAISNSYGAGEGPYDANLDPHYNHPGVAITASSGDSGYGVQFPARVPSVIAVGGTSLKKSTGTRGWTESAWSGAGSGCSAYAAKPSWQHDNRCSRRTVADVSAVADPYTGVATYNTYNSSGWQVLGGTSVASPIIASVFALAGNTASINNASYLYAHSGSANFWDATGGSNGNCGNYLCQGRNGYDGPTGLGTPRGIGGF